MHTFTLKIKNLKSSAFTFLYRIITIHIYYDNLITGENIYSKLSLVDLAGSQSLGLEDDNGEQTTDMLHVMKSLSAYATYITFQVNNLRTS